MHAVARADMDCNSFRCGAVAYGPPAAPGGRGGWGPGGCGGGGRSVEEEGGGKRKVKGEGRRRQGERRDKVGGEKEGGKDRGGRKGEKEGEEGRALRCTAGNGAREDHEHIAEGAKLHVDAGPTSCL